MKWTFKLVFDAVPGDPVEHQFGIIQRAEKIFSATVGLTVRRLLKSPVDLHRAFMRSVSHGVVVVYSAATDEDIQVGFEDLSACQTR